MIDLGSPIKTPEELNYFIIPAVFRVWLSGLVLIPLPQAPLAIVG
jgi:hypothetical protein